ncbi:MAG: hypothetical protein PHO66_07245 [Eubacteriales bacterium]|nr:hypothetical protein [Eubacteriales bacterium]
MAAVSTLPQWAALAQAFLRKPSVLQYGTGPGRIEHNGTLPGFC